MSTSVPPSGAYGPYPEMDSAPSGHDDEDLSVPRARTGKFSLSAGALALAMGGCPWLPAAVFPVWLRYFPLYLIVPMGIIALVSGIGALRDTRGRPDPARGWARAGIALGAVAVIVPVGFVVWGFWALSS
ncbi:DUF4190 domain-containing protein [Streptomyces sp. NPDC046876]|uniref:DUF4190 domain-containing protein n=1 Tax=Streptomyces sp. NPDC046876 TaxID=3155616 RepID=UPI003401625B